LALAWQGRLARPDLPNKAWKSRLARTPITPEVLTQIKDEVLYEEYPAPFDTHYRYAAVFACPSLTVGELDIPMHSDYVGAEEINFPWKVPLSGISPG